MAAPDSSGTVPEVDGNQFAYQAEEQALGQA
jgi:hypothetical protein